MSTVLTIVAVVASVACTRYYMIQTLNPVTYGGQTETNFSASVGKLS
jgi:hypothetical protein